MTFLVKTWRVGATFLVKIKHPMNSKLFIEGRQSAQKDLVTLIGPQGEQGPRGFTGPDTQELLAGFSQLPDLTQFLGAIMR